MTRLRDAQIAAAEGAWLNLPAHTDLAQAVRFFAEHHRPLSPLLWGDAVSAFAEWLRVQRKCEPITIAHREIMLTQFGRLAGVDRSDRVSLAAAEGWIYDAKVSARTQRDRFDRLSFFMSWAVKKKHAAKNPVLELDRPVHKVRVPGVLTFGETWRLLQCALTDAEGPQMLGYFALCVLAGVRPHEVPRLTWGDVYLDTEHRIIEVNQGKGGRSRRTAEISEPLWRILTRCRERGLPLHYFSRAKFRRIRRRAGLEERWENDVMRHTYASHCYVVTHDIRPLSRVMGNSELVLFQNYIRPVPLVDGQRMQGLVLHWSAPREKSAEGTGPKPRRKKEPASA